MDIKDKKKLIRKRIVCSVLKNFIETEETHNKENSTVGKLYYQTNGNENIVLKLTTKAPLH